MVLVVSAPASEAAAAASFGYQEGLDFTMAAAAAYDQHHPPLGPRAETHNYEPAPSASPPATNEVFTCAVCQKGFEKRNPPPTLPRLVCSAAGELTRAAQEPRVTVTPVGVARSGPRILSRERRVAITARARRRVAISGGRNVRVAATRVSRDASMPTSNRPLRLTPSNHRRSPKRIISISALPTRCCWGMLI
jgi:hypothetical protein